MKPFDFSKREQALIRAIAAVRGMERDELVRKAALQFIQKALEEDARAQKDGRHLRRPK